MSKQFSSTERAELEARLYELMYEEAAGQYGAPGSLELDEFMDQVAADIDAMSDDELYEEISSRSRLTSQE